MEWIHWAGWPFLVASTVVVVLIVSLVYTILDRDRVGTDLEDRTRKRDDALATQALIRQDRDVAIGERDALKERARELATRVDALEEALRAAREDAARALGDAEALRRGQDVLQQHAESLRGRNVELERCVGMWQGRHGEALTRERSALANYEGLKTSFEVRGRALADCECQRNAARAELADAGKEREALRERLADAEADGARLRRQLVALREAMAGQVQEIQAAVGGGGEGEVQTHARVEDLPCVCGHGIGGHAAAVLDAAGDVTSGRCCVVGCSCGRYESARHAEAEALARDYDRRMAAGFPCVCGHSLARHEGGTRAASTPAPGHCCSEGCGCLKYEAAPATAQPEANGEAPPAPGRGWWCQACGANLGPSVRAADWHRDAAGNPCSGTVFQSRLAPPREG